MSKVTSTCTLNARYAMLNLKRRRKCCHSTIKCRFVFLFDVFSVMCAVFHYVILLVRLPFLLFLLLPFMLSFILSFMLPSLLPVQLPFLKLFSLFPFCCFCCCLFFCCLCGCLCS